MKTTISIPDPIFESAEKLAKSLGITRSELYTKAVAGFLEAHQNSNITKILNEVYAQEDSHLDSLLTQIQNISLGKEKW